MQIPYEHTEKIKINQHLKSPPRRRYDTSAVIILILPESPGKADWDEIHYGGILQQRLKRQLRRAGAAATLITDLPNEKGTRVILARPRGDQSPFEILTLARKLSEQAIVNDPSTLLVHISGLDSTASSGICEALLAGLLAAVSPMPSFKQRMDRQYLLKRIEIFGLERKIDVSRTRAGNLGNHLARWLTMLPSNKLTPSSYLRLVKRMAQAEGWQMDFLDTRALARKKAGAFLAVAQASPVADAGVVHLQYRPARSKTGRPSLALIGKGICFDTGGVNIKPARHMNGMQEDMAGSAVALGTLLALSRLRVDFPVDCWLALAQNHIGPRAYKPNDVVTACNGTTIEVIHTDAEGRMVLADALALASRRKPSLMIDYATLTGACVYALSTRYSGVFSNRDALLADIIGAGRDSGERLWPFPAEEDYDEALDSKIADIRQCTLEGEADHILAARFLNRFVGEGCAWLHIDLAAGNHKGGLAHIPTDTTGFGVRASLDMLLDKVILEKIQ